MTQREVKASLLELAEMYFKPPATVVWGQTKQVHATSPLIVLTTGATTRHYQPISIVKNGVPIDCYETTVRVQVDLYTKGLSRTADGIEGANENTAVNDMMEFLSFINSALVGEHLFDVGITIVTDAVNDYSEIINDSAWEYRAMTELTVKYAETSVGYSATMYDDGIPFYSNGKPMYDEEGYGLDKDGNRTDFRLPLDESGKPIYPKVEQTSSGGRSQDLADSTAGWFDEVQIIMEE